MPQISQISNQPYILVLFYSKTGSVAKLAQSIAHGIESLGIEARLRTVPEVSPNCEISSPSVPETGAPFVSLDDLRQCSGLALGSPTRFGNMASPLKYFLDTTTSIWFSGELINKPACVFSSTASMHGGQETTLISMMMPLLHHGMMIIGLPYNEQLLSTTQTGGTPYGVTHLAGAQQNTNLSQDEITLATNMGIRLAHITLKLIKNNHD